MWYEKDEEDEEEEEEEGKKENYCLQCGNVYIISYSGIVQCLCNCNDIDISKLSREKTPKKCLGTLGDLLKAKEAERQKGT